MNQCLIDGESGMLSDDVETKNMVMIVMKAISLVMIVMRVMVEARTVVMMGKRRRGGDGDYKSDNDGGDKNSDVNDDSDRGDKNDSDGEGEECDIRRKVVVMIIANLMIVPLRMIMQMKLAIIITILISIFINR